jgi:hypothetical protein
VKLFQQLQDAETSFKIVRKRPDILQLSPEQLQQALKTSQESLFPQSETKKGFFAQKIQPRSTTADHNKHYHHIQAHDKKSNRNSTIPNNASYFQNEKKEVTSITG